jgi:excisionase family DNA binding protein
MLTAEATDMLRLGRSGVYRLIAAKQLESIKIGRCSADQSP